MSFRIGLAGLALIFSALAHAQTDSMSRRVLVVYNNHSRESKKVADYYAQKRAIPPANLCRIGAPQPENDAGFVSVPWDQFDSLVKNPIRRCLKRAGQEEILYIVFSFQTPYRLSSVPSGYGVSVDQYVEDIWEELGPSTWRLCARPPSRWNGSGRPQSRGSRATDYIEKHLPASMNAHDALRMMEKFLYGRQRDASAVYAWTGLQKHINSLPRDARISDVHPKLLTESVRALFENRL